MELYQLNKYENIADRLKRLSSPTNCNTADSKGQGVRENHKPFEARRDPTEQPWKGKYAQGTNYSKFSTLEGEKAEQQHTYTNIQNLLSPRQTKPAEKFERTLAKNIETKIQVNRLEDEDSCRKQGETNDNKKYLAKVRSDGNFKIDEILESFNNYKQNKEKFLSTLNKQLPIMHTENIPEVETQKLSDKSQMNSQRYPQEKGRIFLQIDNIWNGSGQQKYDSAPKFERSSTRTEAVELITDVFSPISVEPSQRPKNFSRSKLISRNIVKQVETQNSQSGPLKTLLSPRGPRVPGKICRNNDKTFTAFKWQER